MARNMKKLACSILAVLMLSSLFMAPVSAADAAGAASTSVRIEFYKPADWADTVKIHIWNAGSADTQWPGADMTKLNNGNYLFETTAVGSCNFVINDGNGKQTSDLYAEGRVSVKNDTVIKGCKNAIRVNFKKPAGWSDDIKYYYYTNDEKGITFTDWPGQPMTKYRDGSFYARIIDMADACIIFTDGTNQFPAALQPGIAVKDGQELIFQDGKYTVNDHNWIQADQQTNYCVKGETYKCKFVMDEGSHFDLYFRDQASGEFVKPSGVTTTRDNQKVTSEYSFNFPEAGEKALDVLYYYHSSYGDTGITFKVRVIEPQYATANTNVLTSDKYDLTQGEDFTVKACNISELTYTFWNDAGDQLTPKTVSYSDEGGSGYPRYVLYTFTASQLGQYQKVHLYAHNWRNPIPQDTGTFVMLNVWANG